MASCSAKQGIGISISITLFFEILYLDMPCAKKVIFFLTSLERSIYARYLLSNFSVGLYPKQKLLRYVFSHSSSKTHDIPTSSGVSDDVVKKTSPTLTSFCFLSISIDSIISKSEIALEKTFI